MAETGRHNHDEDQAGRTGDDTCSSVPPASTVNDQPSSSPPLAGSHFGHAEQRPSDLGLQPNSYSRHHPLNTTANSLAAVPQEEVNFTETLGANASAEDSITKTDGTAVNSTTAADQPSEAAAAPDSACVKCTDQQTDYIQDIKASEKSSKSPNEEEEKGEFGFETDEVTGALKENVKPSVTCQPSAHLDLSEVTSKRHKNTASPETPAITFPMVSEICKPDSDAVNTSQTKNASMQKTESQNNKAVLDHNTDTDQTAALEPGVLKTQLDSGGSDIAKSQGDKCTSVDERERSENDRSENDNIVETDTTCVGTDTCSPVTTGADHDQGRRGTGNEHVFNNLNAGVKNGTETTEVCSAEDNIDNNEDSNRECEDVKAESIVFLHREDAEHNEKREPAAEGTSGFSKEGLQPSLENKTMCSGALRHGGLSETSTGIELKEMNVNRTQQAGPTAGRNSTDRRSATDVKQGASKQRVPTEEDISIGLENLKLTDSPLADDKGLSLGMMQSSHNTLSDSDWCSLVFKISFQESGRISRKEYHFPDRIPIYKWFYIRKWPIGFDKIHLDEQSHEGDRIVVSGTLLMKEAEADMCIAQIQETVQNMLKSVKSKKLKTESKSEMIKKELELHYNQTLAVHVSESGQHLVILSSDSDLLTNAEKYALSLLHDGSDQAHVSTTEHIFAHLRRHDAEEQNANLPQHSVVSENTGDHGPDLQGLQTVKDTGNGMASRSTTAACSADKTEHDSSTPVDQAEIDVNKKLPAATGLQMDRSISTNGSNNSGQQVPKFLITKPQARFLKRGNIMADFLACLMIQKITIEPTMVEKGFIVVTQGNVEAVKAIFSTMVQTETLVADEDDEDVCAILSGLEEFGEKVLVDSENGTLTIVFRSDIAEKVEPYINKLKVVTKEYPLPTDIWQYMQCHVQQLTDMKRCLEHGVSLQFAKGQNNHVVLSVQVDRAHFQQTQDILERVLAKLCQRQVTVDVHTGHFLQSSAGKKIVSGIEESNLTSIHVETPGCGILLTAHSPQGHRVLVYQGNIATINSQVTVLPVCHGQKEWPAAFRWIMNKGLLSADPTVYAAQFRPDSFTITLDCQGPAAGRQVVVMSVPLAKLGKFKHNTTAAVKEALHSGLSKHPDAENLCIALPMRLAAKDNDWKIVLTGVMETLEETTGKTVTIKLSLGQASGTNSEAADIVSEMNKVLSNSKTGWVTDTMGRRTGHAVDCRVKVTVGDISQPEILKQTDALVNSTDAQLKHTNAQVSKCILDMAGAKLSAECSKKYPKGIEDYLVAITDSHGLKPVKQLFHVVLPQNIKGDDREKVMLEGLRDRMLSCLALASSKQFRSITFPTLGTGNLQYPPDKVAETMFATARDFFADMPHSSLKVVNIICFHKDKKVIESFLEKEKVFLQSTPTDQGPKQKENKSARKGKGKEPHTTLPNAETALVRLCGNKSAVEKAAKEIKEVKVPEEYPAVSDEIPVAGSQDDLAGCGLESGDEEQEIKAPRTEAASMGLGMHICQFTLPVSLFTEKHTAVLSQNKEIMGLIEGLSTVRLRQDDECVPCKQFYVRPLNLQRVVAHVMKMLELPEHEMTNKPMEHLLVEEEQGRNKPVQHQLIEEEQRRCIQYHDYIALKSLVGEEFQRMFTVVSKDGDQVEVKCNTPPAPQQMINIIESLRKEELQLPKEDILRLGDSFDTRAEGVDAFILPMPEQGKVIIFSFEYTAVSKAKHVVNVRLGKVKLTARSKRRFDSASPESGVNLTNKSQPSSLGGVSLHAASGSDFSTKSGIKVSVYKTDITKLPVDAIVNAANGKLQHGGGVAYAISRAAGYDLEDEGDQYIKRHGPLKVTEIAVTTGGSLPCKKVLHAVGPCWHEYSDKSECQEHLTQTVFNCLKTAHDLGFTSLAISSISSAIFGVPQEICAKCYLLAVHMFEDQYGGSTQLAHVHFVDISDAMVGIIKDTFAQNWNAPLPLNSSHSTDKHSHSMGADGQQKRGECRKATTLVQKLEPASSKIPHTTGTSFSATETKCVAVTANYRTAESDYGTTGNNCGAAGAKYGATGTNYGAAKNNYCATGNNYSTVDTSYGTMGTNDAAGTSYGTTGTSYSDTRTSRNAPGVAFSAGIAMSKESLASTNFNRSGKTFSADMRQESKQDQDREVYNQGTLGVGDTELFAPKLEIVHHRQYKEHQFHFPGMKLTFQVESVANIGTEGIVLWQQFQKILQDSNSQQIIRRTNLSKKSIAAEIKAELETKGDIITHWFGQLLLIFQLMNPSDVFDPSRVCKVIEDILQTVDSWGRRTVAIPAYPFEKAAISDKHTYAFSSGVYMAVKRFLSKQDTVIKEVHIISTDAEYVEDLADSFSQAATVDVSKQEAQLTSTSGTSTFRTTSSRWSHELECAICFETMKNPECLDKCGHSFCKACLDRCFAEKPLCPKCQTVYGIWTGKQPKDGKMKLYKKSHNLPGFPKDTDSFTIEYIFPPGKQGSEHPDPGKPYKGTERKAYLPNTKEGRKVLMLLKTAFDRRQVFTVGKSVTTGEMGIVWNDIHHKTDKRENSSYGYPDDGYLHRVQKELAAKGVTDKDLTEAQKDFIFHPGPYLPLTSMSDFSSSLNKKQK